MFLNFLSEYGVFFGVLIGVILGLVVAYLLFSRPRSVEVDEYSNEKIDIVPFSGGDHIDTTPVMPLHQVEEEPVEEEQVEEEVEDKLPEDEIAEKDHDQIPNDQVENTAEETETEVIANEQPKNVVSKTEVKEEKQAIIEPEPKPIEEKLVKKTPAKKAPAKPNTPVKKKPELGRYHVLFRKEDSMWYVKREGSDKIVKVLHTQKEAIAFATIKSITQKTSMVIHKRDGKIRKQNY